MLLMPMFGDVSDDAEADAIAQRRRRGDRHERNVLRTWASAVRPPEPPRTLLLPQTLTLTAKHGTFVARQRETQTRSAGSVTYQKKLQDTVLRSFRHLSSEVRHPVGRCALRRATALLLEREAPTTTPPGGVVGPPRKGEVWR
jgi:hypothetical protein